MGTAGLAPPLGPYDSGSFCQEQPIAERGFLFARYHALHRTLLAYLPRPFPHLTQASAYPPRLRYVRLPHSAPPITAGATYQEGQKLAQPGAKHDYEYDPGISAGPRMGEEKIQRLDRKRWWRYTAAGFGVLLGIAVIALPLGQETAAGVWFVGWLGFVAYWMNLNARRFHDMGQTGWLSAITLVPFVGPFMILGACGLGRSDPNPNQWGLPRS